MLSHFQLIPERNGQTDGQTDRRTNRFAISISHVSMTRDKNSIDMSLPVSIVVNLFRMFKKSHIERQFVTYPEIS